MRERLLSTFYEEYKQQRKWSTFFFVCVGCCYLLQRQNDRYLFVCAWSANLILFFSTYLSAFFKYVKQQMRCVMVCWIAPRGRREFKKIFCPSKRNKTKTPGRVRVFFNLCNSFLSSFYLNPSKRERPERAVAASRDYTGKEQGWAWCAGRNHNNISPHLFSSWPTFLRD